MERIVAIHSYRGGTGKSNLAANVAAVLASSGKRIGIIDTDIQSPGIHVLFGLDEDRIGFSLNDYLHGKCAIEKAAYDVTPRTVELLGGEIFLIPSSIKAGEIARILREGYDVALLNSGIGQLVERLGLDCLLIDTHPGLNEETLLSIAIADLLVVLLRPDQQDYQGTAVTVEVARHLEVPEMLMVVNRVLARRDAVQLRAQVEDIFGIPVAGVMVDSDDMTELASSGIFALDFPGHALTDTLQAIAARILPS